MLATTYAYGHQGRMTTEKLKINQQNEITLASYKYNKLGEQVARYLHGSSSGDDFNQQVDYTYNEKGWLRRQNSIAAPGRDLFAQELKYNDNGSGYFNGNIRQTGWLSTGSIAKNYTLSYDSLSRLKTAVYADGISDGHFNTGYSYDANGNLSTLSRKADNIEIDALAYTYLNNGNKLQSVTDGGTNDGYFAVAGNYGYDANGNMTTDPSKGTGVEYNHLNLPERVTFDLDDEIRYTYDAAGNKRIKVVEGINAENNTRLDYSGNFLYENNDLKAIFTSAGKIVPFNNSGETVYKFEYNLQDHLGNTRVVFSSYSNGLPEVMQVTDYYPFGFVMNQQNYFSDGVLSNKYLYNGKELQDDELAGNSLDCYDYGARFYDPELGRFHTVDPMADVAPCWSPYRAFYNNPIRYIDPTGMLEDDYGLDKDGNIALLRETDDKTDKLIALDNKGQETDKSVEVEKGVLNNVKTDKDSRGTSYDYMKVGNNETATKLFEFVAENSHVEWSQVKYGTKSNYISTSHNPTSESGGVDLMYNLLTTGYTVRENIHSHPNRNLSYHGPSGFHPRDQNSGDRELGEWINKYYPSKGIKLKVYEVPLKKYIQYNHKGIVK